MFEKLVAVPLTKKKKPSNVNFPITAYSYSAPPPSNATKKRKKRSTKQRRKGSAAAKKRRRTVQKKKKAKKAYKQVARKMKWIRI